ncbi:hypothetical protein ACWEOE_13230 [Amycolatopsis sp. NPDC004368]
MAGITDETFELVRTFYVPFEDGADDVTPVIGRAVPPIEEMGRPRRIVIRPTQHPGGTTDAMGTLHRQGWSRWSQAARCGLTLTSADVEQVAAGIGAACDVLNERSHPE